MSEEKTIRCMLIYAVPCPSWAACIISYVVYVYLLIMIIYIYTAAHKMIQADGFQLETIRPKNEQLNVLAFLYQNVYIYFNAAKVPPLEILISFNCNSNSIEPKRRLEL